MAEPTCSTCRFSAPGAEKVPGALECRRNPPVGQSRRELASWPQVSADAWCGEFEAAVALPAGEPLGVKPKAPRAKRPAAGEQETRGEQG